MNTQIIRNFSELDTVTKGWRVNQETIAVVPTMGALHEGHLSLVQIAKRYASRVIVTIFVNPKQFDQDSDLVSYPRSEESDIRKLAPLSVDVVYVPELEEIYPSDFATTISVSGVTDSLCGAFRKGHFDGVATIVAKLFCQTKADIAIFGEKDFQQIHVIKRMVQDLNLPTVIKNAPTIRETDGLAMSSRNAKLTSQEREVAPQLYNCLLSATKKLEDGTPVAEVIDQTKAEILEAGFKSVEYLELRTEQDLSPLTELTAPSRLLVAAWLGKARLIDNVALGPVKIPARKGPGRQPIRELA